MGTYDYLDMSSPDGVRNVVTTMVAPRVDTLFALRSAGELFQHFLETPLGVPYDWRHPVAEIKTGLNDINDIPKAWRQALASVQVLYPEAVMAGGCLRDRENGVKVKDIDIFVQGTREDGQQAVARLNKEGWDFSLAPLEAYEGTVGGLVTYVLDGTFPGCPPVQLVFGTWHMPDLLKLFDFGCCQIGFDGRTIRRTPEYIRDRAAGVFHIVPVMTDRQFVRTLERWARLKEKYPDWRLALGSRAEDKQGSGFTQAGVS